MEKAIGILTTLAKNEEFMDLSFVGGYVKICEAINELKQEKEYPRKENADMGDEDVKYRIEEEGIGYTLEHYCSYGDIKKEDTRILFGKAVDALDKLKEHLEVK